MEGGIGGDGGGRGIGGNGRGRECGRQGRPKGCFGMKRVCLALVIWPGVAR